MKEWKKILHANRNPKRDRTAILISNKTDCKSKVVTRGKGAKYILIKGSIHQEDKATVNIYIRNNKVPKHLNHKLT